MVLKLCCMYRHVRQLQKIENDNKVGEKIVVHKFIKRILSSKSFPIKNHPYKTCPLLVYTTVQVNNGFRACCLATVD